LEAELDKSEWEARIFGTNYKSTQREYQHNLMPSIEKIASDEDKKSIKFIAYKEEADKLAKSEIFGKCVKKPANIPTSTDFPVLLKPKRAIINGTVTTGM